MAAELIKPYFYTICVTDKTQTFCCHIRLWVCRPVEKNGISDVMVSMLSRLC